MLYVSYSTFKKYILDEYKGKYIYYAEGGGGGLKMLRGGGGTEIFSGIKGGALKCSRCTEGGGGL